MHWCGDETAAVLGLIGTIKLCWSWLKSKASGWRLRRKEIYPPFRMQGTQTGRLSSVAPNLNNPPRYQVQRTPTAEEMEAVLAVMKNKKRQKL
jgi:hypothetical protein